MKRIAAYIGAALMAMTVQAKTTEPTNLLENGSFEVYECGMMGCTWEEWSMALGSGSVVTDDKVDGEAAIQMYPTSMSTVLEQAVQLTDDGYAIGTEFALTIHYKILSLPEGGSITLDSYWEPAGGGNAEAMRQHDADVLQQVIGSSVSAEWQRIEVTSSKPAGSSYLHVRIQIPKKAKVLFDAMSLVEKENTAPYIHVSPESVSSVNTTIGHPVVMQTLHIAQGNVSGVTLFELSYTNANQFQISQSELSSASEGCDLVITYAPTETGIHTAYLNIDNTAHPTLHRSIALRGTCTDPALPAAVSVSALEAFEVVVGQEQQQKLRVKSENCTDYVYLRVEHLSGTAFTIDRTLLPKNGESEVTVSFRPRAEGSFQSKVTIYSQIEEFEAIEVLLEGSGSPAMPETIDWMTGFVWDESAPLRYMNEHFDSVNHNKTIVLEGWQNVAAADARPWWGFDENISPNVEGTERYAKATAYQWGVAQTGIWEMWLVTPALDYTNARKKVFSFRVMGQYLPEEGNEADLEIFYIDAKNPDDVFFQNLTEDFNIPKTEEMTDIWVSFEVDLTAYEETIADVFHMAFRYTGPNGTSGAVTYYIDDVKWGEDEAQSAIRVNGERLTVNGRKILRDGQMVIVHEGKEYTILGVKIED